MYLDQQIASIFSELEQEKTASEAAVNKEPPKQTPPSEVGKSLRELAEKLRSHK